MKKFLLIILTLVPAVLSAQVLNDWILDEPTGADLTVTQEAATVSEGSYAAKVSLLTAEVPFIFSATFNVTEGSAYDFSIDILDNTTQGSLKIYCEFYDADGEDIFGEDPVFSTESADWQTISWSGTVPTGAVEAYVWIKLYDDPGFTPPVDFYLDNASFTEDGGANLVPNGGFESWSSTLETFKLDFEDGTIPANWLVINANEGENDNGKDGQRTWVIGEGFGLDGGNSIFNDTYEADNENPGDDWFVSPMVKVTDDYVLSFWADADPDFPDSLIVWVSKTGQTPEDFDILVDRLEVAGAYQKFSYVLSDNENLADGDVVYIGFHSNTLGSFIDMDDIRYGELEMPQITAAWNVNETSLDVLYDVPLSGSIAAGDFVLEGTATITFSDAAIDGSNMKLVHLTGASANMVADMTVDSLKNSSQSTNVEFYAGISPISAANVANPAGYLVRDYNATFTGIVMAKDVAGDRVWLQDGTDPRSGVNTYAGDVYENVVVGDEILITSINDPFNNQTELYQPTLGAVLSSSNNPYPPVEIAGSNIDVSVEADTDPAEQYESMLVKLSNVKILSYEENDAEAESDNYYIGSDDAGTSTFRIGNRFGVYPDLFNDQLLVIGDIYNVTGIVVGRDGLWSVMPRSSSDFEFVSSGVGVNDLEGKFLRVFPNPAGDFVKVESSTELKNVKLYNLAGAVVREFNPASFSLEIDLSDLNPGSYILRAERNNEQPVLRKIMIR